MTHKMPQIKDTPQPSKTSKRGEKCIILHSLQEGPLWIHGTEVYKVNMRLLLLASLPFLEFGFKCFCFVIFICVTFIGTQDFEYQTVLVSLLQKPSIHYLPHPILSLGANANLKIPFLLSSWGFRKNIPENVQA